MVGLLLLSSGKESELAAGGQEPAPRSEAAVVRDLPRHPTAVEIGGPTSVGQGAVLFAASGTRDDVLAVYETEFQKQGWQPESARTARSTDALLDVTSVMMLSRTFVKDETRLTVTISESPKDPRQGNLHV